jgi:predicted TIM-barrel fold metal-dependent hydrolase
VPGLLSNLDHAFRSFSTSEPDLQSLPMLPSEYLRRQVRFTPFSFEDTGWLIEQCGAELFMFSTDYPHPEGGRHPFERFAAQLESFGDDAKERFFWLNAAELLGLA